MKRPSHSPARFARLALSAWTALSAVGIFCPLMARATDLGTVGPTYEIAEPHLLQMIEQRLREKERSGELARIEQEARQRGTDSVRQPTPVAGVRTTAAPRTFYFDPSTPWTSNILGAKGRAAVRRRHTARTRLNVVSMTRHLLFFDARDTRQVRRARQLIATTRARSSRSWSAAPTST
jgi:conjugal transfer pilus assembly protein TraW